MLVGNVMVMTAMAMVIVEMKNTIRNHLNTDQYGSNVNLYLIDSFSLKASQHKRSEQYDILEKYHHNQ